jgi:hypothetical protein
MPRRAGKPRIISETVLGLKVSPVHVRPPRVPRAPTAVRGTLAFLCDRIVKEQGAGAAFGSGISQRGRKEGAGPPARGIRQGEKGFQARSHGGPRSPGESRGRRPMREAFSVAELDSTHVARLAPSSGSFRQT